MSMCKVNYEIESMCSGYCRIPSEIVLYRHLCTSFRTKGAFVEAFLKRILCRKIRC